MTDFQTTRLLVLAILRHAEPRDWSLQGFGMLRLYLSPTVRLHVWCRELAVPGVAQSSVHDHPWDFKSTVIAGRMDNIVYVKDPAGEYDFNEQAIICGPGGCSIGDPVPVKLRIAVHESGGAESEYHMRAHEIHRSLPSDGCVTLIERNPAARDKDKALVYWQGEKWVSAEPRPATCQEIEVGMKAALEAWS